MYPFAFIAGVAGLYFAVAAVQWPRPAKILAAVLWMAYAIYEYYVANGTLWQFQLQHPRRSSSLFPVLAFASIVAAQTEPRPVVVAILFGTCLGLVALLAAAFGYPAVAAIAGAGAVVAAIMGIRAVIIG